MHLKQLIKYFIVINLIACTFSFQANGFGILTHEAIIDESWQSSILPLLKSKFPNATADEIEKARSYVYGGSIIPDIGYHPFGSIFFSNLFHYVRTGDFVEALLSEAKDLNEYAFAIGVLCHYTADRYGHSIGTNHAVPLEFPKLKEKFGDVVTYEESPKKHRQNSGLMFYKQQKENMQRTLIISSLDFRSASPCLKEHS